MIKIIGGIVIGIISLTFIVGVPFILIGLPIWAIIDCATSKEKSSGSKTLWIILTFLMWTVGALIYGVFVSTKKSLRLTCTIASIVVIVFGIGFLCFLNWETSYLTKGINQSIVQLRTIDMTALKAGEIDSLKKNLITLSQETHFNFHKREQMLNTSRLFEYYQLIIKHNKIDSQGYMSWHQIFELRNTLNAEDMKNIIRQKELQLK